MELTLTVRDLEADDLGDLGWSGGAEHVRAVAQAWQTSDTGDVAVLAIALPNGRLVACGAVDFRVSASVGSLWMLSVHETLQSLGIGTVLVNALEQRIRERRRPTARLSVEHDNPRAAALYRRLGYRECGAELDSWPIAGGATYVTVVTVLERALPSGDR